LANSYKRAWGKRFVSDRAFEIYESCGDVVKVAGKTLRHLRPPGARREYQIARRKKIAGNGNLRDDLFRVAGIPED
jgi:hypothetical protein